MGDKMLELQQQVRNNSDELQDYLRELGGWVTQMEKKDEQLKKKKTESKSANFEAPRSVEELKRKIQPKEALLQNEIQVSEKKLKKVIPKPPSPPTSRKEDKISASNYDAWSKFDVEKALDDIDKNEKLQDSELSDMDADIRLQRAVVEKDRGNECFKAGKYNKAIHCYTRGMQCDPKNAILPANRAMAYLKTESWRRAAADCSLALSLDDGYVKAYQRRATARKNLKDYAKALEDLNHVLLLEPNNKQAKSEIGELALLKAEQERPKPLKENSPPASKSEESKVKGMFVTNSTPKIKESAKMVPGQIMPIDKPPHLRSKAPLQQIKITEVPELGVQVPHLSVPAERDQVRSEESSTATKPLIEVIDVQNNSQVLESTKVVLQSKKVDKKMPDKDISKSKGLANQVEKDIIADVNTLKSQSAEKKRLKKPSNSIQFSTTWSALTSQQEKETYLRLLNTGDYPKVFKHSMEPAIFSGILEVLRNLEEGLACQLLGISRVPRVSAMILFLEETEISLIHGLVERVAGESSLSTSELKEIKKCFC